MDKKQKVIVTRCSESYKKKVEERADDLGLTMSMYLKILINEDLKKAKEGE